MPKIEMLEGSVERSPYKAVWDAVKPTGMPYGVALALLCHGFTVEGRTVALSVSDNDREMPIRSLPTQYIAHACEYLVAMSKEDDHGVRKYAWVLWPAYAARLAAENHKFKGLTSEQVKAKAIALTKAAFSKVAKVGA